MKPAQEVLFGSKLDDHKPVCPADAVVRVGAFGLNDSQLSKNILCIGGTGSGKTNAINTLVSQLKAEMKPNDVMLIFDTKGDFADKFHNPDVGDLILGNSGEFFKRSVRWNIYNDVIVDGMEDSVVSLYINEIARALFARNESASQPFFPNAARGVFCAYMLSMIRAAKAEKSNIFLNNAELKKFFQTAKKNDYKAVSDSSPDMRYINMYLGDLDNQQALGVLSEIMVMINDTFIGVFGENGDFSIRDFIRKKGGKTLFLEYDLPIGETLSPLYSLLVDLAFKEALSSTAANEGKVYVVLDELKLLPKLTHLDDAVNFGRSMGVRVLAGLQSVTQLYDMYEENKGKAIIAGFCSLFAFRPNDAMTRDYVQGHFGKNIINEVIKVNMVPTAQRRDGHVVEDWDLNTLNPGEAVIGLDGQPPFQFYFDLFREKCI